MLRSVSLLLSLALLVHLAASQRVVVVNPTAARAIFNLRGVTGLISLYENQNGTSIMVNLQGLNQQVSVWSIREQPADNTVRPSDRCSPDYLGGVYNTSTMVNGASVGDLSARYSTLISKLLYIYKMYTHTLYYKIVDEHQCEDMSFWLYS